MGARLENPFVFGEVVNQRHFVDREVELANLVRDLEDGQKIFLLSPRRFGKSSLVAMALLQLRKRGVRTVNLLVSDHASYAQFLEKFAEKVIRTAGPWDRVKDWITRFARAVRPEVTWNATTGEASISLGHGGEARATLLAPEVFSLPGELARNGDFRMAICLDEFQEIQKFDSGTVENAIRNAVQRQRQIGYIFCGSQPSLMDQMLAPRRPFHKSGPRVFLEKIPGAVWREHIRLHFGRRGRRITDEALQQLLVAADLIPYDVQRLAHELWDYAELADRKEVDTEDLRLVVQRLASSQAAYFERQWQQLTLLQRRVLQALAIQGAADLTSQAVRQRFRLGPASSVQKALQSLDAQDVLDRYEGRYFFVDPLMAAWIRQAAG